MTDEEISEAKKNIDHMSRLEMARIWRFSTGHEYLDRSNGDLADYFQNRFFNDLKGFSPEISKQLGW